MVKSVGKMKVLLALSEYEFFVRRGALAKEFLLAIESTIPDIENLFSGIALVITKSEKDYEPDFFFKLLTGRRTRTKNYVN